MLTNTLLRAGSVVTLIGLGTSLSAQNYASLFFAWALGHYTLAFIFSKRQIQKIVSTPKTYLYCVLLLIAGALMIYYQTPNLVIYFGIHHVLSEVYYVAKQDKPLKYSKALIISRFFLNSFCYTLALRQHHILPLNYFQMLFLAIISYGFVVFYLLKDRKNMGRQKMTDYILFETVGLLVAAAAYYYVYSFRTVIFYHGLIWFYIGLMNTTRQSMASLGKYLAVTAGVTGFFFLFTSTANMPFRMSNLALDNQVKFWAYVHFTASFAISALNPGWISRYFYFLPKKAAHQ